MNCLKLWEKFIKSFYQSFFSVVRALQYYQCIISDVSPFRTLHNYEKQMSTDFSSNFIREGRCFYVKSPGDTFSIHFHLCRIPWILRKVISSSRHSRDIWENVGTLKDHMQPRCWTSLKEIGISFWQKVSMSRSDRAIEVLFGSSVLNMHLTVRNPATPLQVCIATAYRCMCNSLL